MFRPKTINQTLLNGVFLLAVFLYPILSFFWRNSYPLLSWDLVILFAAATGVATFLALLMSLVRHWLQSMLVSMVITVVALLQFDLRLGGMLLTLFSMILLVALMKKQYVRLFLPVVLVMTLGASLDARLDRRNVIAVSHDLEPNRQIPPVIHILLDSFIGLDGVPDNITGKQTRALVENFLQEHGFLSYPKAYSRFWTTGDSIYQAFNFRNDGLSTYSEEVITRQEHVITENQLFSNWAKLGYLFRIYQTDHLDFCKSGSSEIMSCWTYSQPFTPSIAKTSNLKARVSMLLRVLIGQSQVLSDLFSNLNWWGQTNISVYDPGALERLSADLLSEAEGTVFFAHLLIPHSPYVYTEDCSIDYETPWWARLWGTHNAPEHPPHVYQSRFLLYSKQVQCTLKIISALFHKLDDAEIFDRSFVLLHGDHGSLIGPHPPTVYNEPRLRASDYKANYSTLFAVKYPGGTAGVNDQVSALDELLSDFSHELERQIATQVEHNDTKPMSPPPEPQREPYVFLVGTHPLTRKDINIFSAQ